MGSSVSASLSRVRKSPCHLRRKLRRPSFSAPWQSPNVLCPSCGRHVSISANGEMLAPNPTGDEILSAVNRFFPWRLLHSELGPRNAQSGTWGRTEYDPRFGDDSGLSVERKTRGA